MFHEWTSANHICYADDAILLAPTPGALQKLIDVCYKYSKENDMLYNVKKSSCIAFIPKLYKDLQLPQMYLGESLLSWDDQQKYLGYIVTSDMKD